MTYYAVIETNVLVSAMLKWSSVPGNVLVFSGAIVPVFNEQILDEYRTVLNRPRFHFTKEIVATVVGEIARLGLCVGAEKASPARCFFCTYWCKKMMAPPHKPANHAKTCYTITMSKQLNLSFTHDELKKGKTHKQEFLEKMDDIMPWEQPYELVKPCYYEGVRGNNPYDLELLLRIHLIQNLYDLSDERTRNEIIDSRAFSDFCEVESSNQIPDGNTIGRFRNLLIHDHIHEQFLRKPARS